MAEALECWDGQAALSPLHTLKSVFVHATAHITSRSVISAVVVLAVALLLGLFGAIPLPLPWWATGTAFLTAAGYLWAESTRADLNGRARQVRLHGTVMCLVVVIAGIWVYSRTASSNPDKVYAYTLDVEDETACAHPTTHPGGEGIQSMICAGSVFDVQCWEAGPEGGRWMRTESGYWLP